MSDNFIDRLELDRRIKEMADRELLEFTARQSYETCLQVADHRLRIKRLENRGRKEIGAVGGIGAIIGAALGGVIDYFIRR